MECYSGGSAPRNLRNRRAEAREDSSDGKIIQATGRTEDINTKMPKSEIGETKCETRR
jgi:hypothetical protein